MVKLWTYFQLSEMWNVQSKEKLHYYFNNFVRMTEIQRKVSTVFLDEAQ